MNSAVLLLSALLVTADAPVQAPPQTGQAAPQHQHAPAVVSTGAGCSSCSGGCSTCCEPVCDPCCKPSLFDKFRGMFAKKHCCEPCVTHCCTPAPCHTCAPAPCCQPVCDPCCKPSLFDKFRGMFAKKHCCEPVCDMGCSTCTSCSAPAPAPAPAAPAKPPEAPKPEPINKPMPKDGKVGDAGMPWQATPVAAPKTMPVGNPY